MSNARQLMPTLESMLHRGRRALAEGRSGTVIRKAPHHGAV